MALRSITTREKRVTFQALLSRSRRIPVLAPDRLFVVPLGIRPVAAEILHRLCLLRMTPWSPPRRARCLHRAAEGRHKGSGATQGIAPYAREAVFVSDAQGRITMRPSLPPPLVNADQIACGASRTICALISSLFLAIHKVFLRKSAFIRTQILSGFALAVFIIVYLIFSIQDNTKL